MVNYIALTLLLIFFLFGGYNFNDIGQAINYYGRAIFPSQPFFGIIIFIVIFLLIIFIDEVIKLIKKNRIKVKRKF
jgi:hypothetical protein